jgi:hypothetical protein
VTLGVLILLALGVFAYRASHKSLILPIRPTTTGYIEADSGYTDPIQFSRIHREGYSLPGKHELAWTPEIAELGGKPTKPDAPQSHEMAELSGENPAGK